MKTTQDIGQELINSMSYEEALQKVNGEGYVYFSGFGEIHINNWSKPKQPHVDKYICLNCKEIVLNPIEECPHCTCSSFGKTHPSNKVTQPHVNFEMLKELLGDLDEYKEDLQKEGYNFDKDIENLQLFFHTLATKPTFAKVAHLELKRLNK